MTLSWLLVAGVVSASPALASGAIRHVGPIVAIDVTHDTVTIEEMWPWRHSLLRPALREFHLAPGTEIALTVPMGALGGAVLEPMSMTDLRPGDDATVTIEHEGDRDVVTSIEITRPVPETGGAGPTAGGTGSEGTRT